MADQITSDQITEARRASEEAARGASSFQAGQFTIGEQLKKTVNDLFAWNKDITEPRAQAMEQFFSAPSAATEKFGKQFLPSGELSPTFALNPLTQNRLIQQATNTAFVPFQLLNELLGMRQGSIADIIGAGTGAFQAQSTQAQNQATLSRQTLQDLVAESQFKQQLAQQLQIAQIQAATSRAGQGLTAAQSLKEEQTKRATRAAILQGIQEGKITSRPDVEMSIMSAGFDPKDPEWVDLTKGNQFIQTNYAPPTNVIGDFYDRLMQNRGGGWEGIVNTFFPK